MTPKIMQQENERSRLVVDGRRTDDHTRCELLIVHEVGGDWVLLQHGWFGVRLHEATAVKMARSILAAVDGQ